MNEITTIANTGRSLTAQILLGSLPQGIPITMTETLTVGFYKCNVPPGTVPGNYTVLVLDSAQIVASGLLFWDGSAEALTPVNVVQVQGLDVKAPWAQDNTWVA